MAQEVYGDDGCWLEPHRRCTKERGGRRCRNRSWWPGGRCHLHRNPAWTFEDWLVGIAAGRRAQQIPAHLVTCAVAVRRPDPPCGQTVSQFWSRCVVEKPATYGGSPQVIIAVGNRALWSTQVFKSIMIAVSPDEALVQLDHALATGRVSETDRVDQKLIEHVNHAALDCSLMDEAIRVGVTVAAVANRRMMSGELPATRR